MNSEPNTPILAYDPAGDQATLRPRNAVANGRFHNPVPYLFLPFMFHVASMCGFHHGSDGTGT